MSDELKGASRTRAFSDELAKSELNSSGRYGRMRGFAAKLEREIVQLRHDLERATANHSADLNPPNV